MMDLVTLNVFFKISDPLYKEIIETSKEIGCKFNSTFIVDDKRFFSHLPLYLFAAPVKNKAKIVKVARKFAGSIKPFKVMATKVVSAANGLVMVDFEKNEELYNYHLQALNLLNPLREGCQREKYQDEKYLHSLPEKDQEKLREYGHLYVLGKYHPHITIARIEDDVSRQQVVKEYENKFFGRTAAIEALRITKELFEPVNRSVLILDSSLQRNVS